MSGGRRPVRATFWLLEAPDSLAEQSRRNPDGYGIATFEEDGSPDVDKRPAAAYRDELFAREAREEESTTFVAHVRYASSGRVALENTHPFEQDGRVFAHNGHVGGLEQLESRLGSERELMKGDTDSERFFALITKEARASGGDVEAAIVAAASWVAGNLPLYALNLVLATPTDLWALRYPEPNSLYLLERGSGGPTGARHLDAASPAGTVRVRSAELGNRAAVILASEQMDEDSGWRGLEPGELVHVNADLEVSSRMALDEPPAHQLRLEDLDPRAAASQQRSGRLSENRSQGAAPRV
jgi:predicted glutamine amidotransferase